MTTEPQEFYDEKAVRAMERTNIPGILLIVVGIINVLLSLYIVVNGVVVRSNPEQAASMMAGFGFGEQANVEQMKSYGIFYICWGIAGLVGCILTIVAGLRMRGLSSYALCMTGAITAALPGISCLGCVGLGQIVGIWAIVVLLNQEVKSSFQ